MQRKSEGEHESSRRLKTQFLIEMEGCGSGNEQILLIGKSGLVLLVVFLEVFLKQFHVLDLRDVLMDRPMLETVLL